MRCGARIALFTFVGLAPVASVAAQTPAAAQQETALTSPGPQLRVLEVRRAQVKARDHRIEPDRAAVNDFLDVRVRDLAEWFKTNPNKKFTLVIDGRVMKGLTSGPQAEPNILQFRLLYELSGDDPNRAAMTKELRQAWAEVLGRPASVKRRVSVTVAHEDGQLVPADRRNFKLYVIRANWFIVCGLVSAAFAGAFLMFSRRSDILRDSGPAVPGKRRPFSLARTQMAVWFFIIFAAFILIWLITGDPNTVKPSLLTLMGISTATALGSVALESKRRQTTVTELAEAKVEEAAVAARLAPLTTEIADLDNRLKKELSAAEAAAMIKLRTEKQIEEATTKTKLAQTSQKIADLSRALAPRSSQGFFTDILSDESGVSLHRLQIAAWTTILLVVFWKTVWEGLAMPEFDANLLTLMGISSGTYIGFKVAEK